MQGGIGNQLFCLYAGRFAAINSNSKLELDLGQLGSAATSRNFQLGDLEFPFAFSLKEGGPRRRSLFLYRVLKRSKFLSKLVRFYKSPVVGFDRYLLNLRKPLTLNGYFQTYEYVSRITDSRKNTPLFKLKSVGSAYLELEKRILNLKPVVLHIRRGDYLDSRNIHSIGALSDDYFMGILKTYGTERPVWVFSNDSNLANFSMFPNLEFISTGALTDLEELMLMSKAEDIVISNSTFSWWSGYLSEGSVTAPAKWFRGLEDPENLCPASWIRVTPDWM